MFWRPRSMLAIDIGSTALRVIETAGRGGKQLRVVGSAPAGDLIDRSGFIRDEYAVQRQLTGLLKSLEIETESRNCAIALTSNAVSIKRVVLDAASPLLPREQMRYLAEQYFEHDLANLQLSLKLMPHEPTESGQISGLLIGARRDVLEQHIATFKATGLRVSVVDCAATCLYNALVSSGAVRDGVFLLLNVGHSAADVAIVQDGVFVYHKVLSLAGRDYSFDIARKLGISNDQAERVKMMLSSGSRPASADLLRLIRANNDEIVDEVEQAIGGWWETQDRNQPARPLQAAFLTGGGTMMLGLRKSLEDGLGLKTNMFNPFEALSTNPRRFDGQHLAMYGQAYSVAVGLTLHNQSSSEGG